MRAWRLEPDMTDALAQFTEQMGMLGESHGMPRIAGRIIGFSLMNPGSFSLDDLAERLQVSKASISTNARRMEEIGILERITRPGDRRDYYRLGQNPWEKVFALERRRMQELLDLLNHGKQTLDDNMTAQHERLDEWRHFLEFMQEDIEQRIERWRERTLKPSAMEAAP